LRIAKLERGQSSRALSTSFFISSAPSFFDSSAQREKDQEDQEKVISQRDFFSLDIERLVNSSSKSLI
jgi:hypothetical protein